MHKPILQVSDNLNGTYTVIYADMTEKKFTCFSVPKYVLKYIESAKEIIPFTLTYNGKTTPLYVWYRA